MLDITDEIPFLWRLSSDREEGFSLVSMVVPFHSGSQSLEHTIQTDIVSFIGDNEQLEDEEVLEWNEDDIALFLKLLAIRQQPISVPAGAPAGHARATDDGIVESSIESSNAGNGVEGNKTQTFRVDLSDPETIEIVHIVAAAGFGMALTVDDLLVTDPGDTSAALFEPEIGTRITLHTVDGYKRGVVVGHEEDEVVCVLLDPIKPDRRNELSDIHPHDLVVVKAHQLLPAHYSSQEPGAGDVLH